MAMARQQKKKKQETTGTSVNTDSSSPGSDLLRASPYRYRDVLQWSFPGDFAAAGVLKWLVQLLRRDRSSPRLEEFWQAQKSSTERRMLRQRVYNHGFTVADMETVNNYVFKFFLPMVLKQEWPVFDFGRVHYLDGVNMASDVFEYEAKVCLIQYKQKCSVENAVRYLETGSLQ